MIGLILASALALSQPTTFLDAPHDLTIDGSKVPAGAILNIRNGQNVTITGFVGAQMLLQGGANLTVDRAHMVGDGTGAAIAVRDATNVTVTNSIIEHSRQAIYLGGVKGFVVAGNAFWAETGDGVDLAGSSDGSVTDNVCSGFINTATHPDCVQGFMPVAPYPTLSARITVARNYAWGLMQGFSAEKGSIGWTVEDNVADISAHNCVDLTGAVGATARNNACHTLPGSAYQAVVTVVSPSVKPTICGNTAEAYAKWAAKVDPAC